MINFRIGCSGYQYVEWKGVFYPIDLPKGNWFEFYCEHFNTIELNVTFYKFPRVESLRRWYDRAPDNFTFSVKAPRVITHFKKLQDSKRYIRDFYTSLEKGLKEKNGTVLYQFPPQFGFDEERLERIVEMLDRSFKNVVEFRNASWWNERVYTALQDNNIIFSGMSHPTLPDPVVATGQTLYYRFHGVPHLYTSLYASEDLETIVSEVAGHKHLKEAYIIFNNTIGGAALTNAKQFQEISELVH